MSYTLLVEGYGLREVMGTPGIDPNKTSSNHVVEVEKVGELGGGGGGWGGKVGGWGLRGWGGGRWWGGIVVPELLKGTICRLGVLVHLGVLTWFCRPNLEQPRGSRHRSGTADHYAGDQADVSQLKRKNGCERVSVRQQLRKHDLNWFSSAFELV